MKYAKQILLIIIITLSILTISCSTELIESITTDNSEYNQDNSEKFHFLDEKERDDETKAWHANINIAISNDGVSFTEQGLFVEHAGVANLIKTNDNKLIAFYQYFDPYNVDIFDKMAYQISSDNGATWTDKEIVILEGFPTKPKLGGANPVDPTLVQLEDDSFRLYFTYHAKGYDYAFFTGASSETIDGTFVYEGPFLVNEDAMMLDPAVVLFQDIWHHYTWSEETDDDGNNINIHSTSVDGITFTRQDDIHLAMNFLGQAIEIEEKLYFYGTGMQSPIAVSSDGFEWEIFEEIGIPAADPGIVELDDGTFLMVYTSMNIQTNQNNDNLDPLNQGIERMEPGRNKDGSLKPPLE
ncbi:exo-alpha-sialidase [archaeon]|jgi:hypothetical protein|nr:exo-alpha-sialidase [archaeon]MBT6762625.1 exo-alpha-sialidase [archaeon]